MTTDKKTILEEHFKREDVIQIRFVFPETRPIFYKGKIKAVNDDNFIFYDIIAGELMLTFDNLAEIKILERGNNDR